MMRLRLAVQLEFVDNIGWHYGKVTSIKQSSMSDVMNEIKFTGGEIEEWNQEAFNRHKSEASIVIRDICYKFVEEC
eukprot:5407123-Ditylum_brightwellii.AAC.1